MGISLFAAIEVAVNVEFWATEPAVVEEEEEEGV